MQLPTCLFVKASALIAFSACGLVHGLGAQTPAKEVTLLDGKLTLEIQEGFVTDERKINKQVIAAFKARKGSAWGVVARSTRALEPGALGDYLSRKAEEYTKGLVWLPKLTWLKKETVVIRGRQWADLRFIGQMEKPKGPMDGMLYTRVLATSYEGQLLEIVFTSNTDRDSETKARIDRILDSVKLED